MTKLCVALLSRPITKASEIEALEMLGVSQIAFIDFRDIKELIEFSKKIEAAQPEPASH